MHPIAVACGLLPAPTLTLTDLRGKIAVVTGANTGIGFRTATNLAKCGATVVFACRSESRARVAMTAVTEELEASRRDRAASGTRTTSTTGEDWSSRYILRFEALDLASLASVQKFVERLKKIYPVNKSSTGASGSGGGIDILVLNAGLNTRGTTNDGFDVRWQVNYLGHWLLASEIMPLLQVARGPGNDGARIVCLSSVMHHFAVPSHFAVHCKPIVPQLSYGATGAVITAAVAKSCYADSKLAMNLLSCELQRRFDAHGSEKKANLLQETRQSIEDNDNDEHAQPRDHRFRGRRDSSPLAGGASSVEGECCVRRRPRCVAVNPGAVASDIWRGVPPLVRTWLLDPIMALVFLSTDEGSATSMHAATQPLPTPVDQLSHPKPTFLPYLRTGFNETCMPDGGDSSTGTGMESKFESAVIQLEEVPYYAPYLVPQYLPSWLSILFELAGPFAGAKLCPQSLPRRDIGAAGAELWGMSSATVHEAAIRVNIKESKPFDEGSNETVESHYGYLVGSPSKESNHFTGSAFSRDGNGDHQALLDNTTK